VNLPGLVIGLLTAGAGAIALGLVRSDPERSRREHRRARALAHRAHLAGLRGRYRFADHRSEGNATPGSGTYAAADAEDQAVYDEIGSRIEGESEFFANEMLWTDARLLWAGIPALLAGLALIAFSVLG